MKKNVVHLLTIHAFNFFRRLLPLERLFSSEHVSQPLFMTKVVGVGPGQKYVETKKKIENREYEEMILGLRNKKIDRGGWKTVSRITKRRQKE